ncbi:MAG: tetratricopeptide repeat protein, partial [Myxococcota bacterium]|nr:tetratricopeptide repeat protein [Myxococcota bacterium]
MRLILLGFVCLAPLGAWAGTCDEGDGQACLDLGEKHARGDDVPRDHPLAAKYFRKACQAKLMPGCTRLGFMFQKGFGVRQSAEAAVKLYEQSCDGGDPDACALLATMYMHGEGVKADPKKAAELMERAGARPKKTPPPPNPAQQLEMMEQSCVGGKGRACLWLGHHYAFGEGGKIKDPKRGLRYFLSGCDRGSAVACTSAGLLHSNGLGTDRDEKRAAELYTRACS